MKEEIEFKWIINLMASKHVKGFFTVYPICKKDFERVAGAGENNKAFSKWFYFMVNTGSIEYYDNEKSRGFITDRYLVNKKIIYKRLQKLNIYKPLKKVMDRIYYG